MLKLNVVLEEGYDEVNEVFIDLRTFTLELEHSLFAMSKWESQYEKPFFADKERTSEETLGYIRAMTITPEVPSEVYDKLGAEHFTAIKTYVEAGMTATWFSEEKGPRNSRKQTITAELIYYWMFAFKIPMQCEHWHLNKLLTQIRVCNQQTAPPKKMSPREIAMQQHDLNERRKAQLGTNG